MCWHINITFVQNFMFQNQTLILGNNDLLIMSTMENLGEANKSRPMKSLKVSGIIIAQYALFL